jgi:serine/threonine-protein kinase HipA
VIRRLGLDQPALEQAYRRLVFNVAAMNRDDHTKNFAFLLPERGTWQLSPAFDVTHAYNPSGEWTQRHQMAVNGKFDGITLTDLHAVADAQGIPAFKAVTREVIDAVHSWPQAARTAGVDESTVRHIQQELRDHDPRTLP